jgi:hypothetical protein
LTGLSRRHDARLVCVVIAFREEISIYDGLQVVLILSLWVVTLVFLSPFREMGLEQLLERMAKVSSEVGSLPVIICRTFSDSSGNKRDINWKSYTKCCFCTGWVRESLPHCLYAGEHVLLSRAAIDLKGQADRSAQTLPV